MQADMPLEELSPPETLYRYRSLRTEEDRNRVRDLLVEGKTFLPTFDQFRDQDESLFTADFNGTWQQIRDFRFQQLRSRYPSLPKVDVRRRAARAADTYPHRTAEQNEELHREMYERIMWSVGLLCFSAHRDSDVLWQRYGDQHRGIAIAMRMMMVDEYVEELPLEVVYSDQLPHLQLFANTCEEFVRKVLRTKPTRWKDETEWRLVFTDRPQEHVTRLKAWYPVEVLLGRAISPVHRELVATWCSQCFTPPKITPLHA